MAVPAFGTKFCTITSCTWPKRAWLAAMASRASTRSARSSPMPTRIPVVKGMASSPGGVEGGQPPLRRLVRGTPVGGQILPQGFDHHPLAGADGAQLSQLLGKKSARVGVGQQPGLVEHGAAHRRQVVDGRAITVRFQPIPGYRIPIFRSLTEGEEGLVAAGFRSLPGDLQHLLGRQVGSVETGRSLGEGAVAAFVPAQHRQGDEDLRRVRDPGPVRSVSYGAGLAEKLVGGQLEELAPALSIGSSHMTLHATWRGGGRGQSAISAAEVIRSGRSRTSSSPGTPLRAP